MTKTPTIKSIALAILWVLIATSSFGQNSFKELSKRKGIALYNYYDKKLDFDFENYYDLFKYRDSIEGEFIAYSIRYFRSDTLILGIDAYKPPKHRDTVAALLFDSPYFERFTNLIVVFGSSKSAYNEKHELIQQYFRPRWVYVRKE